MMNNQTPKKEMFFDALEIFEKDGFWYSYLPDTIKSGGGGGCKLVYVARNPKDTLISQWHFYNKMLLDGREFPLERAVDSFCRGEIPMGPYWDHVLEYWNQSMVSPDKVLFVKYEDLQRDTNKHVRELAAFLGRPFSGEGEDEEEVEKVVWRSSFERLKGLEVNKTGQPNPVLAPGLMNSHLFRRGEVGDWRNYLTVEMGRRIDDVTRMKFEGSGLWFGDEVDVAN